MEKGVLLLMEEALYANIGLLEVVVLRLLLASNVCTPRSFRCTILKHEGGIGAIGILEVVSIACTLQFQKTLM